MNSQKYSVSTITDPSKEEVIEHTLQVWLHAARKIGSSEVKAPKYVSFKAEEDGKVIGGLLAKLQMKVLFIESAWVNPEYQRSGVGHSLREKVFKFAHENECEYLIAQSYEFYDAINYLAHTDPMVEVIGKIENCPEPYTLYFLKRKLKA